MGQKEGVFVGEEEVYSGWEGEVRIFERPAESKARGRGGGGVAHGSQRG